ncbi:hypothetical protein [Turicimonas muris]|uniref:hypothetical protein n=1 Tax=Turicimonas muris TaxID=1796652 RepID=UPI00248AFAD6|nr:hypothetical protein [Turicimonas muris]
MRKLFVLEAERDDDGVIYFKTDKMLIDDILPNNGSVTKEQFRTLAIDAMNRLLADVYSVGELMENEYQAEKAETEALEAANQQIPEVLN